LKTIKDTLKNWAPFRKLFAPPGAPAGLRKTVWWIGFFDE